MAGKSISKIDPAHLVTQHMIQSMQDTIANLRRGIAELQATLPVVKTGRLAAKERYVIDPTNNKKVFY